MAFQHVGLAVQGLVVGVLAFVAVCFQELAFVVIVLFLAWAALTFRLVSAHGYQVLVRTFGTDSAQLREGSFWLLFPDYLVGDSKQFGPWCERKQLPQVGQVLSIDIPEVLVPVDSGVYCLKVNTKVVGVVERYTVQDLLQNTVSVEKTCHDVIAHALRAAVYDKPLEEALAEIQRTFLKDAGSISAMISVPAFRPTQLLLDADSCINPANEATKRALEIAVQRKQEAAKRACIAASMDTEEQKVKLRRVELQSKKDELMLHQEAYGREGAALVEAAKHCKVLYLNTTGLNSTVMTLPSI